MSTIVLKTAKRETLVPRSKVRLAVADVFGKKTNSFSKKKPAVIVKGATVSKAEAKK